jgi:hypothetical protein
MSELLIRELLARVSLAFVRVAHPAITELIIGEKINNADAYRE